MAKLKIGEKILEDNNVRAEYRRLLKLYKDAPKKRLELIQKLLIQAAFIAITLDDLALKIKENGIAEEYQNGANQKGVKKSAVVEVYNTMSKNYAGIMKQLADMLPKESGGGDGFDNF